MLLPMATLPPNSRAPLIVIGFGVLPSPEVNCPCGATMLPLKVVSLPNCAVVEPPNKLKITRSGVIPPERITAAPLPSCKLPDALELPRLITTVSFAPAAIVMVAFVPVVMAGTAMTLRPGLVVIVIVPRVPSAISGPADSHSQPTMKGWSKMIE